MNNLLVIAPLLSLVAIMAAGFGYQQWQMNRKQPRVSAQRVNTVTFTRQEKIAAREWM